jgi:hypothetical protein
MSAAATSTVDPSARRLAAGLLAAPAAWTMNELLGWFISAQACADGGPAWGPLGPAGVRAAIGIVGVAALTVAAGGAVAAARQWRRLSADPRLASVQAFDSREFLAVAGVIVSGAFAGGIVLFTLPAVLVGVCVFSR